MKKLTFTFAALLLCAGVIAQNAVIRGYAAENNNQGPLDFVDIRVYDKQQKVLATSTTTDVNGYFSVNVPSGKQYKVVAEKNSFFRKEQDVVFNGNSSDLKLELERKPGYVFDVTLADGGARNTEMNTNLVGAQIEIYNNTSAEEELVLKDHPKPSFHFNFVEGNHYTVMIRKQGYFNKRVEVYVNINGCILCFEGLGLVRPNVVDVMAQENQLGAFLGSIEMEPVAVGMTFEIENIYYDYDKSNIRPDAAIELDKLVTMLRDNPGITIELGSHTDSRGSDAYNLALSDRRAASAVAYLVKQGGISTDKLKSKGYGETKLVNECSNGVKCSEAAHQDNRRTELTILGIEKVDPLSGKSLQQIIRSEGRFNSSRYQEIEKEFKQVEEGTDDDIQN